VLRLNTTANRTRPGDNFRWNDNDFLRKPSLKEGEFNWLGIKWSDSIKDKEGKHRVQRFGGLSLPSVTEIMVGIQKQEKLNQKEIHTLGKTKEYTYKMILNMLVTWRKIFKTQIHTDFNNPLTVE